MRGPDIQRGSTPNACPFVAFDDDRDRRADVPDPRHRCFAVPNPEPRAMAHQAAYCLTAAFPSCPFFMDWAARAAAEPLGGSRQAAGSFGGYAAPGGYHESPGVIDPGGRPWAAPPPWVADPEFRGSTGPGQPPTYPPQWPAAGGVPPVAGGYPAGGGYPAPGGYPPEGGYPPVQPPYSPPPAPPSQSPYSPPPAYPAAEPSPPVAYPAAPPPADLPIVPSQPPMPVPQVDASPEPPVAPEQLMALPETEDPADYDYELPPIADPTWLQPVPPVDDAEAEDGPELGRLVPMEPVEPATPAAPSYPEANVPPPFVPAAIPPVGPEAWSHPQPPFASMPDDLAPPMPYRAEDQAEPPGRLTGRPIDTGNAPRLNSQARPPRKKSETPAAEWSKPRRFEAYPSLGARVRMRGFSPVLVGAFVVAITALLLFLLPSFLSGGGAALPTRTLAPTATPVPTPTPAPTAQSYTVKAGDVLGTIATRFNVTVSQITCFNDLKNPDRLSIGQVLLIPPEDYFCPEPTPTPRR